MPKSDASLRSNIEKSNRTVSGRGPPEAPCSEYDSGGSEPLQYVAPGDGQERFHELAEYLGSTKTTLILRDPPLEEPELAPLRIFVNKHGGRGADLAGFIELCCRLYFQAHGNRCYGRKSY